MSREVDNGGTRGRRDRLSRAGRQGDLDGNGGGLHRTTPLGNLGNDWGRRGLIGGTGLRSTKKTTDLGSFGERRGRGRVLGNDRGARISDAGGFAYQRTAEVLVSTRLTARRIGEIRSKKASSFAPATSLALARSQHTKKRTRAKQKYSRGIEWVLARKPRGRPRKNSSPDEVPSWAST